MRLSCEEHVVQKLWYLYPQAHYPSGFLQDAADKFMYQAVVLPGLKSIVKRQPYGAERWSGVQKSLWDWITKELHSFQVLPDLESAFKVIDLSNEIGLSTCGCAEILEPERPEMFRCIGLNNAARITFRDPPQPFEHLSKERAREITSEWRAKGCYQTVGWRLGPNVTWLCNCDQACGCHRTPELEWGQIPSFFVNSLLDAAACDGCGLCADWCHRDGALSFGEDGRVRVDQALCKGCGLCIEHCPNHALGFVPREVYYDVPTLKKVRLPGRGVMVL